MAYHESIDELSAAAERQLKLIVKLKKSLDVCIQDYLNADKTIILVAFDELEATKNILKKLIKDYNDTYKLIFDTSEVKFKNATAQKVARIKEAQAAAQAAAKAAGNNYQDVLRL